MSISVSSSRVSTISAGTFGQYKQNSCHVCRSFGCLYRDYRVQTRLHSQDPLNVNGASSEDSPQDINETTKRLVEENPKVREAIKRISDAAMKYEEALQKRSLLEQQIAEASSDTADMRAKALAEAEQEAAEKQMKAAELRLMEAKEDQERLSQVVSKYRERVESLKWAAVSSLGASAIFIPLALASLDSLQVILLQFGASLFTGALFGITYRYGIGKGDNTQQKTGIVLAFGIISSLSFAQSIFMHASDVGVNSLSEVGIYSFERILLFSACACSIEFALQKRFIHIPYTSQCK